MNWADSVASLTTEELFAVAAVYGGVGCVTSMEMSRAFGHPEPLPLAAAALFIITTWALLAIVTRHTHRPRDDTTEETA